MAEQSPAEQIAQLKERLRLDPLQLAAQRVGRLVAEQTVITDKAKEVLDNTQAVPDGTSGPAIEAWWGALKAHSSALIKLRYQGRVALHIASGDRSAESLIEEYNAAEREDINTQIKNLEQPPTTETE